jgi:steroid delta-isomerase
MDIDSPQRPWRMQMRGTLAALAMVAFLTPSTAQPDVAGEAAITEALLKWTKDFNAGDTREICALFAPDLRYDYKGHPERGFDDICGLLQRSLRDRTKTYVYSLKIKEILVSGDLAVVRLIWTLNVSPGGAAGESISEEPGMDIFRRQPDGSWRIIRYMAYEN